jgi:phenylalanyl-tRNA synthetase alpha chain
MDNSINSLENQLKDIKLAVKEKITSIDNSTDLLKYKNEFLGKNSPLSAVLSQLKSLSAEDKKTIGQIANTTKAELITFIDEKLNKLKNSELLGQEELEKIDITLPGDEIKEGHRHILTQTLWECEDIFQKMGFEIIYPYEVDDDYHNFESVNIPKDHPARDAWDTFWTSDGHIAITHTSSMQNRVLSSNKPPIKFIVPGRCFRNEATDARHEHTFHQIEGIYVDKQITLSDMLGTLKEFFEKYFEQTLDIKFTPDFFPFVEPGGMMALTCFICKGKGCPVCKKSGWLEILGCGMIHPTVLTKAGLDPNVYSGFAWGFGLERLPMLKYGIEDIRHFQSGNLDFIKQF